MALFSIRTNSRWRPPPSWIISNGHIFATAHDLFIQRASRGHLCDSTAFVFQETTPAVGLLPVDGTSSIWKYLFRQSFNAHSSLWTIVRENVQNTAKNVKSHDFLDFQKNVKKRKKTQKYNIYNAYSPEDYCDHPQSVLAFFRTIARPLYFNQK